jgi:hypothetical protein
LFCKRMEPYAVQPDPASGSAKSAKKMRSRNVPFTWASEATVNLVRSKSSVWGEEPKAIVPVG